MTTWLDEVVSGTERRLSAFFGEERARLEALAVESAELVEALESLTMRGGKRLRPAVLFAAFKAVKPAGRFEEVADACAALELLQTYLLVHDDWMDGDDERRGGPSVHASLGARHGDGHLGASLAILAGDLASAQSWRLLMSATDDADRRAALTAVALRMHEEVIVGQQLDVLAVEDVTRMHQLKTGSYTLRGPLALGAVLGDASEAQRAALDAFGVPLGEAFQIRDDILGTFGDPGATGKPAGNDLRAGKRTSLVRAAEQSGDDTALKSIRKVHGQADAKDADVAAAIAALESCGAKAAVLARLETLLADARAAIAGADLSDEGRAMLDALAEKLAVRAT